MQVRELVGRLLDHDIEEYGVWRLSADGQDAIAGWLGRQRISHMGINTQVLHAEFDACAEEWERQLSARRSAARLRLRPT